MPDTCITRQKIRDHFRRMWIAYLAGAVIVVFLNNLVFTVTRPSFSDDETLKIMLLNAEMQPDEKALLEAVSDMGIRSVQTVALAAASAQDPASEMLLAVQLTSGFGDIYITDPAGLALLEARNACLDLSAIGAGSALETPNGYYLIIPSNSANIPQALTALPILAEMITE